MGQILTRDGDAAVLGSPPGRAQDHGRKCHGRKWSMVGMLAAWLLVGCGGGGSDGAASRPPPVTPGPVQPGPGPVQPGPGPVQPGPGPIAVNTPPRCADADLSTLTTLVYVAPGGATTAGCGQTVGAACGSIDLGIKTCASAASGCGVLVRWGRYELQSSLDLQDGISVIGSCRFNGEANAQYRSVIVGATDRSAVSAKNIVLPTRFENFLVLGGRATVPGNASIAAVVTSSTALTMRRVQIVAAPGADGPAGGNSAHAADGGAGGVGETAKWGYGAGCGTSYGGIGGVGGAGDGSGAVCSAAPSTHGGSSLYGGSIVASAGGIAGAMGGNGFACGGRPADDAGDGAPGGHGMVGVCGAAAQASPNAIGTITQNGVWNGGRGGSGLPGGNGGGGGGGGRGGACSDTITNLWPGDGGGGGGGACGGGAGQGGAQGGASIPLLLVGSSLATQLSTVIPSVGGRGGQGGDAADGGAGGSGAAGVGVGRKSFWTHSCPGSGGAGGQGGGGGGGSGGTGGNGGPAIGVALLGSATAPTGLTAAYLGLPGAPGAGGRVGTAGAWITLVPEGGTISPWRPGWVRYGVNGQWVYRWVDTSIRCTTAAFGSDPAPNIVKQCQATEPSQQVAIEGQTFQLPGPSVVRYGAGDVNDVQMVAQGTVSCSTSFFGRDPAPFVVKHCSVEACQGGTPAPASHGATAQAVDFDRPVTSMLFAGQVLPVGGVRWSPSHTYQLVMQSDNNVALYTAAGGYLWDARTNGTGAQQLTITDAGALVVRNGSGQVVATVADGKRPGAYLRVDDSGKVSLVDGFDTLWSAP